jgi:predicted transcriptional regulator
MFGIPSGDIDVRPMHSVPLRAIRDAVSREPVRQTADYGLHYDGNRNVFRDVQTGRFVGHDEAKRRLNPGGSWLTFWPPAFRTFYGF